MNHFFAITLPEETKNDLAHFVEQWKPKLAPELVVHWEHRDDYHLTLNFLGNLSRTVQPRLVKAARAMPDQFAPFTIHLSFSGAFTNVGRPSILWAGLNEKRETTRLSKSLDRALSEHGFVIEPHSYVPHITLGRCRTPQNEIAVAPIKVGLPINLELVVRGYSLLETLPPERRENGMKSRYNIVHTFSFENTHSSDDFA